MAASALEEKINKIKLQNEEIKRRHEEVEADKKNAAKLNALVQMVPSSDWPERKEPPELIRKETTKSSMKSKTVKEHSERSHQYLVVGAEGKKTHKFSQGDGPPPDPKYNFLADSEREENSLEHKRDQEKPKGMSKYMRNIPRKRGDARDGYQKDHRKVPASSWDRPLPEYDAWRAERNRIDEARISRQRTAEGNWRREWDSDKTNLEKGSTKKDLKFLSNDISKRGHKEFERWHKFDGEQLNRGSDGSHRYSYGPKNTHAHYDNQYYDHSTEYSKAPDKSASSPTDDRKVVTTDKSIKIIVNQGANSLKGPVMSVKMNAPNIAGTGRVGPRQKTRVTYSNQSEVEKATHQIDHIFRQKSFDEKMISNNTQRSSAPKSPCAPKKKESGSKSPYPQRKDMRRDNQFMRHQKHEENFSKSPYLSKREYKDTQRTSQVQSHPYTTRAQIAPRTQTQNVLNNVTNNVIKNLNQSTGDNESSTDHSKLEDKESEKSKQIFSHTNLTESDSNLNNQGTENNINSEILNKEILGFTKNQTIEIVEKTKVIDQLNNSPSKTEKLVKKSEDINDFFVDNENESVKIATDTQKKNVDQIQILEKNLCLNTEQTVSLDTNFEEKTEILGNLEILNISKEQEPLIKDSSNIEESQYNSNESNKFETVNVAQNECFMKIDDDMSNDKSKNSCEALLGETQLSGIKCQSENLNVEIPNIVSSLSKE